MSIFGYMMRAIIFSIIFFIVPLHFYSQTNHLKVSYKNTLYKVQVKEYHKNIYFSLFDFIDQLSIPYHKESNDVIEADFENTKLIFTANHPFIIIKNKNDNQSRIFQLPVSSFTAENEIYIPVEYSIKALSAAFGKELYLSEPLNLFISNQDLIEKDLLAENLSDKNEAKSTGITKILVYEKDGGIVIRLFSDSKISSYKSYYNKGEFKIILNDIELTSEPFIDLKTNLVSNVACDTQENGLEITLNINLEYNFSDIAEIPGTPDLVVRINVQPNTSEWLKIESENFIVIYRESHSPLVHYIISSSESSLKLLMDLFDYVPSEKIVINLYDVSDYGFGATTTVPQNYIRIEIEPLEPGYENIPYNERLQWLISHELVHIVINDQASGFENLSRNIFQKVTPEQVQPITVFYSILTNFSRYTPRWHQEAIAVFLETWMSGGFGRILGNFDEMYFRTMVLDNLEFPSDIRLDAKTSHNSFLIETLFYLYGARFAAFLSIKYDSQKLLQWFKISSGDFYTGFKSKFEKIFKEEFDKEWENFIRYETDFQKKNIEKLNSSKTTYVKRLNDNPLGFATQPHFDPVSESVIFGYHKPHHLSSIQKLNLNSLKSSDIGSLPTPSQYQVASTAFDYETGLFFYTTNNNQLYRDICVLNIETGETKVLFKDARIGHLTITPLTHELWGIKHSGGKASIMYSPYPYNILEQLAELTFGDEIQQLSVDHSGKFLAATLLNSAGVQSILLINTDSLLNGKTFSFTEITSTGTPENPSWSLDGKVLYWNSYNNGVSNIYKVNIGEGLIIGYPTALTHTLRGLFKPIYIGENILFAFEFTTEGLLPVIIEDKAAGVLPAIEYLGQEVTKTNSIVYNWYVTPSSEKSSLKAINEEEKYNGLENLKIQTFIPVISGFQKQKMLGIFTHISDPLLMHDITIETGYSPFNENPAGPKWHFKGKYEYKKQWQIGLDHNAPDFYDLFNERKRGLIGTRVRLGHTHYWIYDNPLKIKQETEVAYYFDQIFINDNLVRVSQPDFGVAQTNFNSKDLRRTIGSSDYEYGNEFNVTVMAFGTNLEKQFEFAGQIFGEWDNFTTTFFPHNILHFKLAAGYHNPNNHIFQSRFFFGGFGNRALENVDVKQYRKVFRFPGIPIYSLDSERFLKVMIENNLPPLRFGSASIGSHYLNHIDFAVYSQALYTKSSLGENWINIGAQMNLIFKHWFNLESALSAGIANAWFEGGESWEWFVSFKLLKN